MVVPKALASQRKSLHAILRKLSGRLITVAAERHLQIAETPRLNDVTWQTCPQLAEAAKTLRWALWTVNRESFVSKQYRSKG